MLLPHVMFVQLGLAKVCMPGPKLGVTLPICAVVPVKLELAVIKYKLGSVVS